MPRRRDRPRGPYVRNPGRRQDQTRRGVEERRDRTAALTRAGHSASEIAVRLGVDQRTVLRYRQQLRQQHDDRGQRSYQLAS